MSTLTPRTPFARTKPPIDLGHFGTFELGKLTKHRQLRLEQLGKELQQLQEEATPAQLADDATAEQVAAEEQRVKAAEQVLEHRYVEIICEQIETMLLQRDPTSKQLGPAEGLADQLVRAFRDEDVPEEKAVGLDDLISALDEVMSVVDQEQAQGNA